MNEVTLKLLRSLGITFGVSIILSFGLSFFVGNFLAWFLILTVVQFLVFYVVGEIVKKNNNKKLLEITLKQQELKSQQSLTVVCPCDRRVESTVTVKLNEDNTYVCQGCNKNIGIQIEAKTALLTTPLSVNPIDTPLLAEHVKQLLTSTNAIP